MATLPDGWEFDYDGTRWFYRYKPSGIVQYNFPKPGDEFPEFVTAFSPPSPLLPEERLESQQQVERRGATNSTASTTGVAEKSSGQPPSSDAGRQQATLSSRLTTPASVSASAQTSATVFGPSDPGLPWFQPDSFAYLGQDGYLDVSPLQEGEAEEPVLLTSAAGGDDDGPPKGAKTDAPGNDKGSDRVDGGKSEGHQGYERGPEPRTDATRPLASAEGVSLLTTSQAGEDRPAVVVGESVAAQPIMGEPVLSEPLVNEAVVSEPVMGQTVVGEPVVSEVVVAKPPAGDPPVANAVVAGPVISEPVVGEPVTGGFVVSQPTMVEPVATGPLVAEPVVAEPILGGVVEAGAATGAAVIAGEPVVSEPIHGDPVAVPSTTAEPVMGEPVYGDLVAAHPVVGEPVISELVGSGPVIAEPVSMTSGISELADTTPVPAVASTAAFSPIGLMAELESDLTALCFEERNPPPVELPGSIDTATAPPPRHMNTVDLGVFQIEPAELPENPYSGPHETTVANAQSALGRYHDQLAAQTQRQQQQKQQQGKAPQPASYRNSFHSPPVVQGSMSTGPAVAGYRAFIPGQQIPATGHRHSSSISSGANSRMHAQDTDLRLKEKRSFVAPVPASLQLPRTPPSQPQPGAGPAPTHPQPLIPGSSARHGSAPAPSYQQEFSSVPGMARVAPLGHVPSILKPANGRQTPPRKQQDVQNYVPYQPFQGTGSDSGYPAAARGVQHSRTASAQSASQFRPMPPSASAPIGSGVIASAQGHAGIHNGLPRTSTLPAELPSMPGASNRSSIPDQPPGCQAPQIPQSIPQNAMRPPAPPRGTSEQALSSNLGQEPRFQPGRSPLAHGALPKAGFDPRSSDVPAPLNLSRKPSPRGGQRPPSIGLDRTNVNTNGDRDIGSTRANTDTMGVNKGSTGMGVRASGSDSGAVGGGYVTVEKTKSDSVAVVSSGESSCTDTSYVDVGAKGQSGTSGGAWSNVGDYDGSGWGDEDF